MADDAHIIIVEDDPEIRALVTSYLSKNGFSVGAASGSVELDRMLATSGEPDLIVLDVMLPGEDGLAICRRLRARSRVPIMMLTARGDDVDRIVGLELGADDYLAKPFNPRELVARIRAILRRQGPIDAAHRRVRCGPIVVDLDARRVVNGDGQPIELTSAEFDLLACFVTRPGRVLSRDQLMDWTRGRRAEAFDRTIDVQLSRLRKKIEVGDLELIKTVRNAGYVLTVPVSEA
ncbi:MAG: response regulator [Hyphomicrobiaceae bacterium]|nr:response regulator [Hyphomicrobiaceae bacterium]